MLNNSIENLSDVWALGIVFYELFFGINLDSVTAKKIGLYDQEKKGNLLVDKTLIHDRAQEKIAALIKRMTSFESQKRIQPDQVLSELQSIKSLIQTNQKGDQGSQETKKHCMQKKYLKMKRNPLEVVGINTFKIAPNQNHSFDHAKGHVAANQEEVKKGNRAHQQNPKGKQPALKKHFNYQNKENINLYC